VAFAGLMIVKFLFGELAVIGFGARLLLNYFPILHGKHFIKSCAPEVSTDCPMIVGNEGNFNHLSSLNPLVM
jgi:hypothetical protein